MSIEQTFYLLRTNLNAERPTNEQQLKVAGEAPQWRKLGIEVPDFMSS